MINTYVARLDTKSKSKATRSMSQVTLPPFSQPEPDREMVPREKDNGLPEPPFQVPYLAGGYIHQHFTKLESKCA